MALILNIETATPLCSVALANDSNLLSMRESFTDKSHAQLLTVFIDEIFKETGIKATQLNAVAVGKGPGSYTGLRIGISTAKGICYGANIPLIALNTLEILFHSGKLEFQKSQNNQDGDILFCPMIDARRLEVYTALFHKDGSLAEDTSARIIDHDAYNSYFANGRILFFGSGASKCREMIKHPNALFLEDITPSALAMINLSTKAYQNSLFENTAYFEPYYLKDFVTTIPKKKLIM